MGASEIKQRAFMLTHGHGVVHGDKEVTNDKKQIWKYACLAFPNSDKLCYEFSSGAVMYLEEVDFYKIYNETGGEVIILFYNHRKIGDSDITMKLNEVSYMQLKGQGFNPRWEYYESDGKYLMHNGNKVVSELFVKE